MHYGGLLSFAVGGTILLIVFMNILQNYNSANYFSTLFWLTTIFGFIGFFLVGYGLFVNIEYSKSAK